MLRIRLSRKGKTNEPHFALIVTEKTNPVSDGNFLEKLGHFNPRSENSRLIFDKERTQHWISMGAQPTETVARLLHKNGVGGMDRFVDFKKKYNKKKKGAEAEEEKKQEALHGGQAGSGKQEEVKNEEAPVPAGENKQ